MWCFHCGTYMKGLSTCPSCGWQRVEAAAPVAPVAPIAPKIDPASSSSALRQPVTSTPTAPQQAVWPQRPPQAPQAAPSNWPGQSASAIPSGPSGGYGPAPLSRQDFLLGAGVGGAIVLVADALALALGRLHGGASTPPAGIATKQKTPTTPSATPSPTQGEVVWAEVKSGDIVVHPGASQQGDLRYHVGDVGAVVSQPSIAPYVAYGVNDPGSDAVTVSYWGPDALSQPGSGQLLPPHPLPGVDQPGALSDVCILADSTASHVSVAIALLDTTHNIPYVGFISLTSQQKWIWWQAPSSSIPHGISSIEFVGSRNIALVSNPPTYQVFLQLTFSHRDPMVVFVSEPSEPSTSPGSPSSTHG